MIVKMNKLTFLIYHKEYEAFLEKLRVLGVVHVEIRQSGEEAHVVQDTAEGNDVVGQSG